MQGKTPKDCSMEYRTQKKDKNAPFFNVCIDLLHKEHTKYDSQRREELSF
jgi:bifunctional ADP-heptose synthase (sugar kinase/adenylyltransferase)